MLRDALIIATITFLAALGPAGADDTNGGGSESTKELTLERLFPEKGLFGPSASDTSFSHDGAYAAYLYRPYDERRHGSDLWIYDVTEGTTTRVTSVSVMSEFREDVRKVRDDRIEKQKKARKKQRGDGGDGDGSGDEDDGDDGAAVEDPLGLTGAWSGTLRGGQRVGLSRRGMPVELALRLRPEGRVSGHVTWLMSRLEITAGSLDASTGALTCSLRASDGTEATLEATVKEGELSGTITITEQDVELRLKAQRDDERDGGGGETGGGGDAGRDDRDGGDVVDRKDADDEKAPRYDGVRGFVWAPQADELIFTAGGDLYRYELDGATITRLTRTSAAERDVQYLPDGSGYTFLRDNALVRITFGSHMVEQIDPKLESGEQMSGYRISPDGSRLVVLAAKGESIWQKGRQVNIVNYRDRFAKVRQVNRHVSDDPLPEREYSVYLYDLEDHLKEQGQLSKVYTHKQSGPRDVVRVPEWSPDSSRVAWAVFEQTTGHVEILEAGFEEPEDDGDEEASDDDSEDGDEDDESEAGEDQTPSGSTITEARAVYRFLHNGGPTTPSMVHPYYLADGRRLVFLTELSGFRHLHVLDPTYEHLEQLTDGQFEVYPLELTRDHARLFCTATKDDPAQQHVFSLELDSGELRQLSRVEGYYSDVAVSPDAGHVLANLVDFGRLRELVAFEAGGEELTALTDSHPEEARELTEPVPEYFTFENRHGQTIHGHMFKPDGWTPDDRRPLLIYVYGGPLGTRKMITRGAYSAPSYFFAYYMAKKHGYVTCTVDPRGASGYGGLFEKSNFEQVGKPQVEDLVDTARWFVEHQGVDEQRIGLHGWSFGGFQTQMCLYTEPDVFAAGIAGAGPTEWENYNSWYSTATIGPSREGKTDLEEFSLLPLAKNLKARLLLVHGMEDSNVLYQDTVRVYRELLKAGKEALVDLFLDPTGGHGLGGDVKTLNRYRKYEEFLLRTLGTGGPPAEAEGEPGAAAEE